MSSEEVDDYLQIDRYGDFELTDAIRPCPCGSNIPVRGFKDVEYRDNATGRVIPGLVISETRKELFALFMSLLEHVGSEVRVVLERSNADRTVQTYHYVGVDRIILESNLWDHEHVLTHDGLTGLSIVGEECDIQFDEHKLIWGYGNTLMQPLKDTLNACGILFKRNMRTIWEGVHVHQTSNEMPKAFHELRLKLETLGLGDGFH